MLAVFYEGNRVDREMDLDMYYMLDLYRDAKTKLRGNGFEVPELLGLCLVLPQLVVEGSCPEVLKRTG